MTENQIRQQAVSQARAWLGRKEADGGHREIIDAYNAIRPLPAGYAMRYTDPWCAAFVSAVAQKCALTDVLLPECSCDRMIALYKARGRWAPLAGNDIKPGDLVFYDWDRNGTADHVGIIAEVTAAGYRVIEGNISDSVGYRTVRRDYNLIRGFCRPDYAGKAGAPAAETAAESVRTAQAATSSAAREYALTFHILAYGAGIGDAALREEVRAAQRLLKAAGFDIGPDGADGEFGWNTKKAVMDFQRSKRLTADGIVGPRTRAALDGIE